MATGDKELEHKLLEAGNKLSKLPTDVDVLLPILDQVENLLAKVEQSPSESIQNAYSPSMKALLEEPLLRHSNVDVRVAIASCISEITRITAPEAPYDDDQMKDVFQLIVSSFENLYDKSSRSYNKRASILETVAKVRSCVVMLDLECDELIAEMFQHFLNSIRDYHPDNVFTSMETIMTLVLEESEDVPVELLKPILSSLESGNEEIPTIASKLGERVFEKCADKIRPYLRDAVKSVGVSLDDYNKVVASICEEGTTGAGIEHNDDNVSGEQSAGQSKLAFRDEAAQADESKLTTASSDGVAQNAKVVREEVHPEAESSLKSAMSNGMTETGNEEGTSAVSESSKKPDESNFTGESVDVNLTKKVDTDDSDAGKSGKSEAKLEQQTSKRRRRKTEPSSDVENRVKKAEKSPVPRKSDSKDTNDTSTGEDQHVDTGGSMENEKEFATQITSAKALDNEVVNVASLSPPSKSLTDESLPKAASQPKKKENLAQEEAPSVDPVPPKLADRTISEAEVKPQRHSEKEKDKLSQEDEQSVDPLFAKVADGTSDSEVKAQKRSRKNNENRAQEYVQHVDLPILAKVADVTSDSEVKTQSRSKKKKETLAQENAAPSVGPVSARVAEEASDSEDKPQRRSGKKKQKLSQDAPSVDHPVSAKVAADETSDSEVTPQRAPSKKKSTARITKEEKSKAESETASDSEAKPLRQSTAKKGDPKLLKQLGNKGETSRAKGKPLKKQSGKKGFASDSETKLSKQSSKKEDTSNEDKVPSKKDDGKRRGHGKDTRGQETVSSPKSPKSVKDNVRVEDSKTNSKRKRTLGKDKVSGNMEYGANLVGSKVRVWWPKDREFYEGVIDSYDPDKKKHKVVYTDGDQEILVLQKEKWEFVDDDTMEEEGDEDSIPDSPPNKHKSKKAKIISESVPKQQRMDISPKRGGAAAASSSKTKGKATTKSGSKATEDGKVVNSTTLRDKTSNKPTSGKSDDNLGKTDGKDVGRAAASKSKDDKTPGKNSNKGKTPQSGGGSKSANGTGKVIKSSTSSSKVKEATEDTKGKTLGSGKKPEASIVKKRKSPDASSSSKVVRESEGKKSGGKKRRRG